MTARAKTRAESTTKVKRLSFHQHKLEREKPEKVKTRKLQWVPTREKPIKKAPEKMPYFRDNQPKYEPAKPTPQQQVPIQPKPAGNFLLTLFIIIIAIFFVFVLWKIMSLDDGGGGGGGGQGLSGCPVSCNGLAITIAPQCSCPPGSRYRDTISGGYKQCICN